MADMRLTKRLEDGQAVMDCKNCELKELQMCTALGCRNRLKDRLAEYEDAAANVAPVRHGRWEFVEQQFYMGGFINILRCSECENRVDREYRFCPNCGAEMDLEADHEAG